MKPAIIPYDETPRLGSKRLTKRPAAKMVTRSGGVSAAFVVVRRGGAAGRVRRTALWSLRRLKLELDPVFQSPSRTRAPNALGRVDAPPDDDLIGVEVVGNALGRWRVGDIGRAVGKVSSGDTIES